MKPILNSFMFFDDIQHTVNNNAPGTAMNLVNPQNVIRTPFIPSTYSFAVAFGVMGVDFKSNHILSFQFINPQNEVVIDTSEINIPPNPNESKSLPIEAQGYTFNLNLRNVQLKYEGKYLGRVSINKEVVGEFPLFVFPMEN